MITTEHKTQTSPSAALHPEAALAELIESIILPLGYELVSIEVQNHREKKLRVFIDLLTKTEDHDGVDIEDCVKVTHALDQPLETHLVVDAVMSGAYELEVSSPGVERPLRKTTDFDRFAGKIARVHTYRPLTGDETRAPEYSIKNPKQKNFYGVLRGYSAEAQALQLGLIPDDGNRKKQHIETLILIPLEMVSKAHLEPVWDAIESRPNGRRKEKNESE